jgi:phosphate transport system substrate-binding protein
VIVGATVGRRLADGWEARPVDKKTQRTTGVWIIVFVAVAVGGVAVLMNVSPGLFVSEEKSPPPVRLKTGGTSSAALMMDNGWRIAYRKEKGVEVDYTSTGSSKGVAEMIDGAYPVAFTHAPLTDEQRKKAKEHGGELVQVPVILCAAVPVYNLAELKGKAPLRFTGEVLGDIFLGKIQRWNDAALKKLNEGVDLPDTAITVVHREDSSGTTLIFADYLYGSSDAWRQKMGPARAEFNWPVGVGKPRSNGVVSHVYITEGALGYVDLALALSHDLDYGAVQNKDRTAFIHVEPRNMTASARGDLPEIPEDLGFELTNKPGADSYPICGVIYAICYQSQPASSHDQVVDLLRWLTHEGQRRAERNSYAPLPAELIARVEQKLQSIKLAQ